MNQDNVRRKEDSKDVDSQVSSKFHTKSPKDERDPSTELDKIKDLLEEKGQVEIFGKDESAKFPETNGKESELKTNVEAEKEEPETDLGEMGSGKIIAVKETDSTKDVPSPTLEHWLISLKNFHDISTETVAIKEHPASWLAKYGAKRTLAFAIRITEKHYEELQEAGYR